MLTKRPLTVKSAEPFSKASKPIKKVTEPENPTAVAPLEPNFTDNLTDFINRIRTKGSKAFDPVFEAMVEIPTDHANGVALTHAQVCRAFDVTSMTLYKWRNRYQLPTFHLPGGKKPPVRYDEGIMLAWGRLFNKKVVNNDYREWV